MAEVPWLASFAAQRGLKYEADADERWLRAWEPYWTILTAFRYEHALHATGEVGSISIARVLVHTGAVPPAAAELGAWIVIAQDTRVKGRAAISSDRGSAFSEKHDLISVPLRRTGDAAFDQAFATFAEPKTDLDACVTPSLRKLLLGWRIPMHAELRDGGFVLLPVNLGADPQSLHWLLSAVHLFGDKAGKRGGAA